MRPSAASREARHVITAGLSSCLCVHFTIAGCSFAARAHQCADEVPDHGRTMLAAIEIVSDFDAEPGQAEALQSPADLFGGQLVRLKGVCELPIRKRCDEPPIGG